MSSKIKLLVDGGKASAGPPLGPALGPLGVNVGQVVAKINEATKSFEGMKVPVDLSVDPKTKQFEVTVGTPPVSALLKKEIGIEKGAKTPGSELVGNLTLSHVGKIAKLKIAGSLAKNLKAAVKEVLGTCVSSGISVDGKDPRELQGEIDDGRYDELLNKWETGEVEITGKAEIIKVERPPEEEKPPEEKPAEEKPEEAAKKPAKGEKPKEKAEKPAKGEKAEKPAEKKGKEKGGKPAEEKPKEEAKKPSKEKPGGKPKKEAK